jgi:hypothetical protein
MSQNATVVIAPLEDQVALDVSADAVGAQAVNEPCDVTASEPAVSGQHRKQQGQSLARASTTTKPAKRPDTSKTEIVLKRLRLVRGVTVGQIMEATGWQAHSVRGFLSAVVRKKLGLDLVSDIGKDGQRRYRIVDDSANTNAE